MNINRQMRYGAYSEYSFRTTKTGKGDTGFEESMKPDNNIQYKSLGIGFLNVGDTGYGMRATQIINPDSEDTIVRVSIALGGNEFRDYDVNLSEIDPSMQVLWKCLHTASMQIQPVKVHTNGEAGMP